MGGRVRRILQTLFGYFSRAERLAHVKVEEIPSRSPLIRIFRVHIPPTGKAEPISAKHGIPKRGDLHPNPPETRAGQILRVASIMVGDIERGAVDVRVNYSWQRIFSD